MPGFSPPFSISHLADDLPGLGAPFYADTTAGLAATVNGEYFQIPGDGVTSFSKVYKNNAGVADLIATSPAVAVAQATAANSYRVGAQFSSIDATVEGSLLFDGTTSYPNKLGVNNTKPVDEPAWGARTADSGYVAGVADVAGILGGYDNVNNALAALMASQHSMIYSTATHAAIFGGSLHTILGGSDYSAVWGGTGHKIEADCDYSVLVGGEKNLIEAGGTTETSGQRGVIVGGQLNIVSGQYGVIVGSNNSDVTSKHGTVLNGDTTLVSGLHGVASGFTNTVSGNYSVAHGNNCTASGARSYVHGDTATAAYDHCISFGLKTTAPFAGSRVFSARQRGSNAGYNQSLQFECSNETTDGTTATRLPVAGSSTYPTCPAETHIVGTFHVSAVDSAGNIAAWTITFGCKKGADGATPTQGAAPTVTQLYDGIGVAAAPSINFTTDIFRVSVLGKAATNIRWTASFVGNMTKWT